MKIKTEDDNGAIPCEMENMESASAALDEEETRLRANAENSGDAFAMAAYGRFLQFKRGNVKEGAKWQRRAVEAVAKNLSPNVDPTIRYC
jgi:hypothetical protein